MFYLWIFCRPGPDPVRIVRRSLHEFVFGEIIEAAEGVSVAGIGHVCDLVGAQDVGGDAADAPLFLRAKLLA